MLDALGSSLVAFFLCLALTEGLGWLYSRITKKRSRGLRWGSLIFSLLIAVYYFVANLGR